MSRFGLVLQGGGMRGIYTAGVLDCFLEHGLIAPYVAAVSAGACNALTYLAREKGLGKSIYIEHLCDMRFFSWRNLFRHGCMLGLDCLFDEIRWQIRPLAFDVFSQATEQLVVAATNFETGESVYFSKDEHKEFLLAVRASCSIPLLSGVVQYQGVTLLDGGLADPIPIEKSLRDGNERIVVVRTGTEEYVRQPVNLSWLGERLFPRYKHLVRVLFDHHRRFNETLARIRSLREEKRAFVITPSKPVRIRRVERNPARLLDLYTLGYQDASRVLGPLCRWIES
ncbi:patatin family protein [Brevibacillus sp. WF146]|uniref:patatin-like phospholipase family protein n=1 Tax=Brevibacillus sp. WF146 TaxID=319501 RepID=UPI0007ED9B8C|nr:patatin family protein [Brevibacillus sp. WF146]UYZ14148.1 patatin family protein [Brevibacillus sp. WF146]